MNIHALKAIYLNTLQKEWRSKTLGILLVLTLITILFVNYATNFAVETISQENALMGTLVENKKLSIFYLFVNLWVTLLAIVFGIGVIRSDMESGTISHLLAFPIRKIEYLSARFLGVLSIVMGQYAASLLLAFIVFSLSGGSHLDMSVFNAFLLSTVCVTSVLIVSMLISLYFSKIISFIFSVIWYFIVIAANAFYEKFKVPELFDNFEFKGLLAALVNYIFPRASILNSNVTNILMEHDLTPHFWSHIAHFGVTFILLFALMNYLLGRKEF